MKTSPSTYQNIVSEHVEDHYGITLTHPERIETPDRNGRVYCESLYIATAPWDYNLGKWSSDVERYKFDNRAYVGR